MSSTQISMAKVFAIAKHLSEAINPFVFIIARCTKNIRSQNLIQIIDIHCHV